MLAGRYRIVAMEGKGGMGEVYRAEDLTLGQTVALKFLPEVLRAEPEALARFHREVRIARQVSHPNVCRVFDIGEADGLAFLSMEYVDGEDLSSLLRRIGRLPQDKALEIARQLCAGLAAAHEFGVLHRDLKPSNVMIDGRGKARITDFGLAGVAGEFSADEIRAGTPAYMAPEQLEGKEVTVRSDIYALGLVLYEIFTGKRAFEAPTMVQFKQLQEQGSPASPSSLIKDLDPAIERAILRCLEKDPRRRPASALQVAAALPGGDPLAAALAAGETPSPEMVAASGETAGVQPRIAWSCLAGVLLFTFLAVVLAGETKLYRMVPLEKPPEALAERAQEILRSAGHTQAPADTAFSFYENNEYLRHIQQNDSSKTRWNNLETGALGFWFRSAPKPLEPVRFFRPGSIGTVLPDDPPLLDSGMTLLRMNPRGRLTQFFVVPPQVEEPSAATPPTPDWAPLFAAAGLDAAQWTPAQPSWTPPVHNDARAAWTGVLPERPQFPMRIEAAAYRGKPVYFDLIGPWRRPARMRPYTWTASERVGQFLAFAVLLTLMIGGALLARRNFRLGRGDRKGAARLAATVFALLIAAWLFRADHVPNFYELAMLVMAVSFALFVAGFVWLLYLALEPYVRRRWPATLISWSRLLAGGWRDPLVGRDLLVGCLVGAVSSVISRTSWFLPGLIGSAPPIPSGGATREFLGARIVIERLLGNTAFSVFLALAFLFLLFLARLLLRKDWLAGVAFVLLFTALASLGAPGADALLVAVTSNVIINSAMAFLLIRFGLLALIVLFYVNSIISVFPLTPDVSAWYAGISFAGVTVIAALAAYGFYFSLGGRPMFGAAALDE